MPKVSKKRKKVVVIFNGSKDSTSGKLFTRLSEFISSYQSCELLSNKNTKMNFANFLATLITNLLRIRKLHGCDTLILHCYAVFSLPLLFAAVLLKKRVVLFRWDIYPTSIDGVLTNNSKIRTLFDKIENQISKFATVTVVPSDDFRPFVEEKNVKVMPIWPNNDFVVPVKARHPYNNEIKVCFVGQVNDLRGVDSAIEHLLSIYKGKIQLHLFSSDNVPKKLKNMSPLRLEVVQHGFLDALNLKTELLKMHFGLVCLNAKLDQPGFPSKTFEYVSVGLSVLYFGRDLPAYTSLLEQSRLGINITYMDSLSLDEIYNSDSPAASVRSFLEKTELSWDSVNEIIND